VHSFHTLLGDLATLTRNVVRLGRDRLTAILATPTPTQHRALDLLGVTACRVDRPTPLAANYINGLRSKEGKVRLRQELMNCLRASPVMPVAYDMLGAIAFTLIAFETRGPQDRRGRQRAQPGRLRRRAGRASPASERDSVGDAIIPGDCQRGLVTGTLRGMA
jgi:hypothetical protein